MSEIAIITNRDDDRAEADDMLGGMIEAQTKYGQITWVHIDHHIARGHYYRKGASTAYIAVVDLDDSNALDAMNAAMWVNS